MSTLVSRHTTGDKVREFIMCDINNYIDSVDDGIPYQPCEENDIKGSLIEWKSIAVYVSEGKELDYPEQEILMSLIKLVSANKMVEYNEKYCDINLVLKDISTFYGYVEAAMLLCPDISIE